MSLNDVRSSLKRTFIFCKIIFEMMNVVSNHLFLTRKHLELQNGRTLWTEPPTPDTVLSAQWFFKTFFPLDFALHPARRVSSGINEVLMRWFQRTLDKSWP